MKARIRPLPRTPLEKSFSLLRQSTPTFAPSIPISRQRKSGASWSLDIPRQSSGLVVLKMGGSSLGNGDAINRSAQIMHDFYDRNDHSIVVVSALYGITNKLVDCCQIATKDEKRTKEIRETIRTFHLKQADSLLSESPSLLAHVETEVDHIFRTYFDPYVDLALQSGNLPLSSYAQIVTLGERLCVPLIGAVLRSLGIPSVEINSDQLVMKQGPTDDDPLLIEESVKRLRAKLVPHLQRNEFPVITGFIGGTLKGEACTLGRGGSDLSASLVAYALNADELHLWKVEGEDRPDGFMSTWKEIKSQFQWTGIRSADPTKVKGSQIVNSLTYDEATELTHFGKKVLHREAMMPCKLGNIPIYVRNTARPLHPGTKIESEQDRRNVVVVAFPFLKYEKMHPAAKSLIDPLKVRFEKDGFKAEEMIVLSLVSEDINQSDELRAQFAEFLTAGLSHAYFPSELRFAHSAHNVVVLIPQRDEVKASNILHESFVPQQLKEISQQIRKKPKNVEFDAVFPEPHARPLFSL